MQIMNREHPEWATFYEAMVWSIEKGEPCKHTLDGATSFLVNSLHFAPEDVAASVEHFKSQGSYCDCEIVLRMGPRAMEELRRLRRGQPDTVAGGTEDVLRGGRQDAGTPSHQCYELFLGNKHPVGGKAGAPGQGVQAHRRWNAEMYCQASQRTRAR